MKCMIAIYTELIISGLNFVLFGIINERNEKNKLKKIMIQECYYDLCGVQFTFLSNPKKL